MSDSIALDTFLDKWRARWPEWSVADVFVAPGRRALAMAWFALLQEFEDILNVAGDPLPADAKLAWWSEELRSWAVQRSRHPLGRLLEPLPAPWPQLAEALPVLAEARARPADAAAAFAGLHAFGRAVAAVEAAVLGRAPVPEHVVAQILAARLAEAGPQAVPAAFAPVEEGADPGAAQRAWARYLQARWPAVQDGARERRILSRYARGRLQRYARAGQPAALPAQPALLLSGWWAARGGE